VRRVRRSAIAWWILVATIGCGGAEPAPEQAPAKAEAAPVIDEAAAARQKERERKQQAEEAREAEAAAKVDALAVLPDRLPKNLEAGCKAMLAAYDGFMRKVLKGDQLTKWTTGGDEMQVAVFRKECLKRGVKVAACQAHALGQATAELEAQLPEIMQRCAAKFGGVTGEATAPP
jgi:hypothetical protein